MALAGVGKSFVIENVVHALLPPGVLENLAYLSAKAFLTDTSMDGLILAMEEMKSSWLYSKSSASDTGSTEEINLLKWVSLVPLFECLGPDFHPLGPVSPPSGPSRDARSATRRPASGRKSSRSRATTA